MNELSQREPAIGTEIRPYRIGYAFCGSFCTLARSLTQMRKLAENGCEIHPIISEHAAGIDTRFGKGEDLVKEAEAIAGRRAVTDIAGAEPFGPKIALDLLVISPCTGNTLAKIAAGITDSTVTMAAKAHLRRDRPILIALASNDALSQNLHNIACLLLRKAVFFLPMRQDDPENKESSLVADMSLILPASIAALEGRQLQPLLLA